MAIITPEQEMLLEVAETLTHEEHDLLVQMLRRIQAEELDPQNPVDQLLGRSFSKQERIMLEMDTLTRKFANRRHLLENALTASEVATLLGTSRQTPHDRQKAQTMIGLMHNGAMRFPAWQFDPTGADGVVHGLGKVLKALEVSDYAKLNWLKRPNPMLENRTPIDVLKQGELERVLQEAQAVGHGQD